MNIEEVKIRLIENWYQQIAEDQISLEDMKISLSEQIAGLSDLSADELTDEFIAMLGWDEDKLGYSQFELWEGIVNSAALIFINGYNI